MPNHFDSTSHHLQKVLQPPSDLLSLKRGMHSKEAPGVHATIKIERKDIYRPAQTTKTCHASFPLIVSTDWFLGISRGLSSGSAVVHDLFLQCNVVSSTRISASPRSAVLLSWLFSLFGYFPPQRRIDPGIKFAERRIQELVQEAGGVRWFVEALATHGNHFRLQVIGRAQESLFTRGPMEYRLAPRQNFVIVASPTASLGGLCCPCVSTRRAAD